MLRLLSFIIVISIISCNIQKPIDKDKDRIDAVCDNVMQNFKTGKIHEAMQLFKENSELVTTSTIDTIENQILDQIKSGSFSQYGKAISYEFVSERKLKSFAVKRYYALRFQKYFFKFVFSLYNGDSGWKICGFKYDEDVSELF